MKFYEFEPRGGWRAVNLSHVREIGPSQEATDHEDSYFYLIYSDGSVNKFYFEDQDKCEMWHRNLCEAAKID